MKALLTSKKWLYSTWILGFLLVLAFVGCKDQVLQKSPLGEETSASFFQNKDQAVQATNATYNALRQWPVHVFSWLGMTDIASDDADKGSTPSDASFLRELDEFNFDAGNTAFADTWRGYYMGIYRANLAIQNIPNIDMDANLRARLVGENKFLRAYFYFFLVRAYGGVPLIKAPLKPSEFQQPRASKDDVYGLIIQDLKDAINVLPLKSEYPANDMGRATKGAAQGLLAKVYLFRDNYDQAGKYAHDVINSGEYSLYPSYSGIFTRAGENSSGSIFEVQATATESNQGGTQYSQVQGVRGQPNLGWGFNNPSDDLLNSYDIGDPRQDATILFVWETLPDGSAVVHDNPNMTDERYNQKAFVPTDHPGNQGTGPSNIRRLRYSDVLLIAAEADYQNGNATEARQYVNMVRKRARGGRNATVGTTVEQLPGLIADTLGLSSSIQRPFIRYVSQNSPAESAGLQSFDWQLVNNNSSVIVNNVDVIQSVNGNNVTTPDEYYSELDNLPPASPVTIQVERYTQTYNNGTIQTSSQAVQVNTTTQQLLPDVTASGQNLLDAIWHERRSELAMEQQRYFDLVREGRAADVLQALGKNFTKGVNELYPIPQGDVDLAGLQQNPGY
ncbi:MAG TPA: RagB/SusD family nutrient uptake outer membrane protein [Balneolaceae bacterium]|nr:RagB/SusD family nutrient uptake outer membrane protein [Balneolaceae bacterium]